MPITRFSNQHGRSRRAYATRPGGPLTRTQKSALAILAKEAFAATGGDSMWGMMEDEWRHEQVAKACGKYGLTECDQGDYKAVQARFFDLKGETGRAMDAHMQHQTEPVRIARHKLTEALRAAKLGEAYAVAIARNRFKCSLDQCNAKQVWQLVYTINNRRG